MTYSIIVCAKAESVRLPGKNLLTLQGKPLIQHTFDTMKYNFDPRLKNMWCISDSPEILRLAHDSGIGQIYEPPEYVNNSHNMPLMRWIHEKLSSDKYYLLPPTSPVRAGEYIADCVNHFNNFDYMSGHTVYSPTRGHYVANGALFMWDHKQLEYDDIIGERPRLYPDKYNFDIDTLTDFKRVEKFMNGENNENKNNS